MPGIIIPVRVKKNVISRNGVIFNRPVGQEGERFMVRVVNKANKRLLILEAAMRVFARRGIANTRMIEVAEEAGIGKGTIYEYFRSKEEIFTAGFEYFFQTMDSEIVRQTTGISDIDAQLRKMLEISIDYFNHTGREFMALMVDFWADAMRHDKTVYPENKPMINIYERYITDIAAIISAGQEQGVFRPTNPRIAASVFIAALDGLLLQSMMMPGVVDLPEMKSEVVDQLMSILILDNEK
jgi:TetR/AcrR family fatty acid metabolism transcriptional regulator